MKKNVENTEKTTKWNTIKSKHIGIKVIINDRHCSVSKEGYTCLFIKIYEFSLQPELQCSYIFGGEIL